MRQSHSSSHRLWRGCLTKLSFKKSINFIFSILSEITFSGCAGIFFSGAEGGTVTGEVLGASASLPSASLGTGGAGSSTSGGTGADSGDSIG